MQQPPQGYGPPPSQGYGPPPRGYGPQGYGPGFPPPKKKMSTGMIVLIVFGCLFGSCTMCGVVGQMANKDKEKAGPEKPAVQPDPSAIAAKNAAAQKAADEAKAAKEKNAVETFPTRKTEITASLTKAKTLADTSKWAQANEELSSAEKALSDFKETSVAEQKEFQQLDEKAAALRKRVDPQVQKLAKAAAAASAEAELKASSVAVNNSTLFNDYQANEVAADARYKGKKLLVTGTVASIDKGPFGGLILRLATSNEFMSTMCDMESSEQSDLAQLQKGMQVRVLCNGSGMTLGSPSLSDCVFR